MHSCSRHNNGLILGSAHHAGYRLSCKILAQKEVLARRAYVIKIDRYFDALDYTDSWGLTLTEDEEINWRVEFHKALSNPNRLEILELIGDKEICQCEIFPKMGLAQSTISSYLAQLVRADVLDERKDGARKLYKISDPRIREIIDDTKAIAGRLTD
ncbi:ArsR family transcriptional regulator [Candidatus Thorarchaeota archaeon]|nr:MAG: ArsR family transcriptional regulator [Candidatus Thorarchaeota archaeon]